MWLSHECPGNELSIHIKGFFKKKKTDLYLAPRVSAVMLHGNVASVDCDCPHFRVGPDPVSAKPSRNS